MMWRGRGVARQHVRLMSRETPLRKGHAHHSRTGRAKWPGHPRKHDVPDGTLEGDLADDRPPAEQSMCRGFSLRDENFIRENRLKARRNMVRRTAVRTAQVTCEIRHQRSRREYRERQERACPGGLCRVGAASGRTPALQSRHGASAKTCREATKNASCTPVKTSGS